jgi:hypothetical protein
MNAPRDVDPPNSGIMVIRAWNEAGRADAFRARLTYGTDDDDSRSTVFADVDDVLESVRAWLMSLGPSPTLPGTDASD